MILLLIPLAAFFSAVCVALAVLARSMKEGQYYMTPLYLVCMPLIFLTLMPGIELNLFYSLVPVTGVALLLAGPDPGQLRRRAAGTSCRCWCRRWSTRRWPCAGPIDQFQREDVLFREAERFSLSAWLRHLFRDREPTPTGGQAILCFALILTSTWFLMQYLAMRGRRDLALGSVVAGQSFILIPPVIMAVLLDLVARRGRCGWPGPSALPAAGGRLVVALNPLVNELRPIVEWLFPISSIDQDIAGPAHVPVAEPVDRRSSSSP